MTLHFTVHSDLPPDMFLAALTNFSEQRPQLWPNLDRRFYLVHARGDTWAEVTEGSDFAGGIWERARYDWSQQDVVTISVLDSNAFAAGSFWEYRVEPDGRGGSHIDFTLSRIGRTIKGRLLAGLLRVFGSRVFRRDLERALDQIASGSGDRPERSQGAA